MKKYCIANPFSKINHGITNYVKAANSVLSKSQVDYEILDCNKAFNRDEFQEILRPYAEKYWVEVPDTQGMFSEDHSLNIHVRQHAPILTLERLNRAPKLSLERFQRESKAMSNAKVLSSPSLINSLSYKNLGVESPVFVYPNPIDLDDLSKDSVKKKTYDFVFIGRHQRLKGIDYLIQVLSHLPKGIRVAILGVREEDFDYYKSPLIDCEVHLLGWCDNTTKVQVLKRSKVCLILSRFESFSMVAAEALSLGCQVLAWNGTGIAEAFKSSGVTFVPPFDIKTYCAVALDLLEKPELDLSQVERFISNNNSKFIEAVQKICSNEQISISLHGVSLETVAFESSTFATKDNLELVSKNIVSRLSKKDLSLYGFCINSESAQNMWGGLLNSVFKNYKINSKQPLGTYFKKGFEKIFEINPNQYKVLDWSENSKEAVDSFMEFNPELTFIFNGNTPQYRDLVSRLYDKTFTVPIYSELGWLPQTNHIYFDVEGANAHSSIAKSALEQLTGILDSTKPKVKKFKDGSYALLTLQLPGDTTLQKDSYPLQIGNQELIELVRAEVPPTITLVVRSHPMDTSKYTLEGLYNVSWSTEATLKEALSKAHSLIAVNSTTVIEAMAEDINIYTFGSGVFSNKNLTIDCSDGDLKGQWLNRLEVDSERRYKFLEYLRKRQFEVSSVSNKSDLTSVHEAVYPIYFSYLKNESERKLGLKPERPRGYTQRNSASKDYADIKKELIKLKRELAIYKSRRPATLGTVLGKLLIKPLMSVLLKSKLLNLNKKAKTRLGKKILKFLKSPYLFFEDFVNKD